MQLSNLGHRATVQSQNVVSRLNPGLRSGSHRLFNNQSPGDVELSAFVVG